MIFQMGYAEVGQRGQGIHTRQFARSFIFAEGDSRVVLVTAEVQAVGIAVRREVSKPREMESYIGEDIRNWFVA